MNNSGIRPCVLLGIPKMESEDDLGRQLSAAGCDIDRARTVGECRTLLEKRDFELVVLDLSLNGSDEGDTVSLCRRSGDLLSESHLIFTSTGRPITSDDLNIAMSVGAKDVVQTPVSATMVEQMVRLATERRSERLPKTLDGISSSMNVAE